MTLSLTVFEANKIDTLFLFYADILNGCTNADESRIVHLLRDDFRFELLLRNFSLPSQLRLRNVKNELDRDVKLINMLILKYVLKKYEKDQVDREEIKESRNKYGKPKLENRNYQYNISDEVGVVCLAIGFNEEQRNLELGVDLANPKDIERFELPKLENFYKVDFRSIFGTAEIEQLDRSFKYLSYEKRLQKLSQIWALKESYCKYLGVGITAGMENFQFLDPGDLSEIDHDIVGSQDSDFPTITLDSHMKIIEGYDVPNSCFQFPHSKLICSVFGHYKNLCLVKLDVEDIISEFTQ